MSRALHGSVCHHITHTHAQAWSPLRLRKLYRKYANDQLGSITHGVITYVNFCSSMQVRPVVLRLLVIRRS